MRNSEAKIVDSDLLSIAAVSDIGFVREKNEDCFGLFPEKKLIIVADGMGGHNAGDVASTVACENLPQIITESVKRLRKKNEFTIKAAIKKSLQAVSHLILGRSEEDSSFEGMGSTIVLGYFFEDNAYIANIGDSRAYLYYSSNLFSLSNDHTVVAFLQNNGQITEEEARLHPAKHMLVQFAGMKEPLEPFVKTVNLTGGERFLLCTDGLTDVVEDEAISAIIPIGDPSEVCRALVDAALGGGARDNITVVVADWKGNHSGN